MQAPGWQTPEQLPVTQSGPTLQLRPSEQRGQPPSPPQSMSLSLPLSSLSLHEARWQVRPPSEVPASDTSQTFERQSVPLVQRLSSTHLPQNPPPQSMS